MFPSHQLRDAVAVTYPIHHSAPNYIDLSPLIDRFQYLDQIARGKGELVLFRSFVRNLRSRHNLEAAIVQNLLHFFF